MSTTAESPRLETLAGNPAPPGIAEDFRGLCTLPPAALEKLWQVLGPCLADELSKDTEQLIDVFCHAYGAPPDELTRALKACRFLLRTAVKCNLAAERLAEDIDRLCPEQAPIRELLVAGYEPLRAKFRSDVLQAAVVDYGNVLVGAQWRLDVIEASEQGASLRVPVALLTFHYREGKDTRRITFQVLPEMMLQLKKICGQIVP